MSEAVHCVEIAVDAEDRFLWADSYDFNRLPAVGEEFVREGVRYRVLDLEVIHGRGIEVIWNMVCEVSRALGGGLCGVMSD